MTYRILPFSQLDTGTLYELLAHRQEVFVLEQGNIYPDLDGWDQKALHLLAREEDLAVKKAARKQGLGGELVRRACRWLLEESGGAEVEISAMAYLEKFYRELGFVTSSEVFDICGVSHIMMKYHS